MKISKFATSEDKELGGVWREVGGGMALLIARFNNTKYTNKIRTLMTPYQSRIQRENMTDEEAEAIQSKAMSTTIILDWRNMEDDDGTEIPYSSEKAYELLMEYKEFKSLALELSTDISFYRDERIKKVIDNIKK